MYDEASRLRWAPEPPKRPDRSPFERDRARVLHSAGLRRLAAKTQVAAPGESDFPRTRLTHSLECAQIGRELGRALGADPDLVDAACLAHDLGHPPFGHNGEAALEEVAQACGGFEGNAQSFRLLTRLEAKTFALDGRGGTRSAGLNLTRAALDAATKYPWPRAGAPAQPRPKFGVYADDLEVFAWVRQDAPEGRRCLEAQVMDWADDVAYSAHDLEDTVHAGDVRLEALGSGQERPALLALCGERYAQAEPGELEAALERLLALPFWPSGFDGTLRGLAALKNLTSQLIGRFASAAERATRERYGPGPLRRYDADLVVPREVRLECDLLKAVVAHHVMTGKPALHRYARQREVVHGLVTALWEGAPGTLDPALHEAFAAAPDDAARLRVVVDQVALLTDPSAVQLHARLAAR